ncbi:hypothetical protein ACH5RR_002787 [Cinchona calisaya]|uniref:Leucine-rich repeat-containing N-terminal plant-type domain-containing protein n=1 Tax=Cinchona calisaya TaxID=153742 RepID=A0ABD3AT14_9GENT
MHVEQLFCRHHSKSLFDTFFFTSVSRTMNFFLIIIVVLLNCCYGSNEAAGACIEYEKQALLTFKQDLITDLSNRLSSWTANDADCCKWEGVVCDNVTNHVTELRLQQITFEFTTSRLKLNPSLLNLKRLRFLDLSQNYFGGIPIPSFIGSLKSLEYLNLSYAGFFGSIPPQLGNLSNLHTLSVGEVEENNNLHWLTGLSYLELLDMTDVDLSTASSWPQVINTLPSLTELHLANCHLDRISPLREINFSSLRVLDLSFNHISSLPRWIFGISTLVSLDLLGNLVKVPWPEGPWNLTSLNHLDLSKNYLNGSLPRELLHLHNLVSLDLSGNEIEDLNPNAVSNLTNLQNLDMSDNNIHSIIPNWLYSCKSMTSLNLARNWLQGVILKDIANLSSIVVLDLTANQLTGRIPNKIGNPCNIKFLSMSDNKLEGPVSDLIDGLSGECFSYAIEILYLANNQLSGQLTDKIGQFENLKQLDLGSNFISGPIPSNIGVLSYLISLLLRDNKLNGTLPQSIGQLSKLEEFDISRNSMEGIVTQSHLENLTNLRYMKAPENSLTLEVDQNWVSRAKFLYLDLSSWKLGPQFPTWLRLQKEIYYLDLSFTGISGAIPSWFWNLGKEFNYLDLSHNQLRGDLSNICCIDKVYLSSNQFSGQLPNTTAYRVFTLDLSNNSFSGSLSHFLCDGVDKRRGIDVLDLGKNLLSGEIPDCWMNWPSLNVINLANNNLSGRIPRSIGYSKNLLSLHLSNNNLSGELPSSMNCTELITIDVANNKLVGKLPTWLGLNLSKLRILILRSNAFRGELSQELCNLTSLRILDVGSNHFQGVIPSCFENFTSMATMENVSLRYDEVTYYYNGYEESQQLATKGNEYDYGSNIQFVSSIDLSNNNFSGKIPDELTNLLGLKYLNLSGNQLKGMIPRNIGQMKQLESLDLSRNHLSGSIPSGISQLSFLSFFNLSYNNLSGEIPLSTQIQSFDASCFVGNQLCGRPLTENCSSSTNGVTTIITEESDEGGVNWLYIFMGSGFVVGFWGVCFTLILKKTWRYAYFRFVDEIYSRFV